MKVIVKGRRGGLRNMYKYIHLIFGVGGEETCVGCVSHETVEI